ncbi:hypothetical protein [Streptomyces sp. NBC_01589]
MKYAPPAQTGEQVLASAMRTAISRGDNCLVLWHDSFERTGEGDVALRRW